MGRPTKRTKETVNAILAAVEQGASNKAAYLAAGITESTFYLWMQDPTFSEPLAQARARAVISAEQAVFGGSALTWLQRGPGRTFHADSGENWPTTASVEITGKDGGPVSFDVTTARDRLLTGVERLAPPTDQEDEHDQ